MEVPPRLPCHELARGYYKWKDIAFHLRQIAESLELETKASPDEMLEKIEGKLVVLGCEPKNTQTITNNKYWNASTSDE